MVDKPPTGHEPMPPVPPDELRPSPPPKEIRISFWAWLVSAAMGFVAGALLAFDKQRVIDELVRAGGMPSSVPPDQVRQFAELSYWALLVGIFGFGLLYVLFVFKMRAGRNWARIVLTVLAVLGLMSQAQQTGVTEPVALLSVLVSAVGLVFMFMPAANAYFNEVKKRR